MKVHDMLEVFVVYKSMKLSAIYKELSDITIIDLKSKLVFITSKVPWNKLWWYMATSEMQKQMRWFIFWIFQVFIYKRCFDSLNRTLNPSHKPSIKEDLKLKLMALPSHLKYIFLGDDDTLYVIRSAQLFNVQLK